MLTKEAQEMLDGRTGHGERMLAQVWGRKPLEAEDREAAAKDAISDILTALYGPVGKWRLGRGLEIDEGVLSRAHTVARLAVNSYLGDAEDYVIEPEPGQYGYEWV